MTRIEMPIIEMTREEVIKTLKEHKIMFEHDFGWDRHTIKALEMAISALSENKGDLISRQAVIDELEKWDWQDLYLPIHFKQILDDIPSVENKGDLISRQAVLDELEKWDWQDLYLPIHFKQILDDIPSVENKGDLISRQAVLDGIAEWIADGYADSVADCSHISSLVSHLPSAENKGEWIKIQSGDKDFPESIVCSVCGGENSYLDFGIGTEPIAKSFVKSKYCPNCGAKMKGGE